MIVLGCGNLPVGACAGESLPWQILGRVRSDLTLAAGQVPAPRHRKHLRHRQVVPSQWDHRAGVLVPFPFPSGSHLRVSTGERWTCVEIVSNGVVQEHPRSLCRRLGRWLPGVSRRAWPGHPNVRGQQACVEQPIFLRSWLDNPKSEFLQELYPEPLTWLLWGRGTGHYR